MFSFLQWQCLSQSLNGSHITLIPKHDNAVRVSDFRPSSLLNTSIKELTKILASRLQFAMPRLIHKNQYGFIKARSIQDCLAWSLEYLHLCNQTRNEIVIFKLDFEKAFDKVEHELMIQIMENKGFPAWWIMWMKLIFQSGTSAHCSMAYLEKFFTVNMVLGKGTPCHHFYLFWQLISSKQFLM